jgi:hypothetical protein
MAFSTTYVWIEAGALGFFAKSGYFDARLESRCNRPGHLRTQAHKFASIRPIDARDRTGATKVGFPGCTHQAALFPLAAAIVVSKEIFTLGTGWSFHIFNVPMSCPLPAKPATKSPGRTCKEILAKLADCWQPFLAQVAGGFCLYTRVR